MRRKNKVRMQEARESSRPTRLTEMKVLKAMMLQAAIQERMVKKRELIGRPVLQFNCSSGD